jgi:hypothetical protein
LQELVLLLLLLNMLLLLAVARVDSLGQVVEVQVAIGHL